MEGRWGTRQWPEEEDLVQWLESPLGPGLLSPYSSLSLLSLTIWRDLGNGGFKLPMRKPIQLAELFGARGSWVSDWA